jgi:hypothetical protein
MIEVSIPSASGVPDAALVPHSPQHDRPAATNLDGGPGYDHHNLGSESRSIQFDADGRPSAARRPQQSSCECGAEGSMMAIRRSTALMLTAARES